MSLDTQSGRLRLTLLARHAGGILPARKLRNPLFREPALNGSLNRRLGPPARRLPAVGWLALAAFLPLLAASGCMMASRAQNVGGVHYFQKGDFPQATARFQRAIQSDPTNPDGYYNMAALYARTAKIYNRPADLQQAEAYYHQAIDRDPNHRDAYRGLAVLLAEQGRRDDAQKLLAGWVQRNPTSATAKVELARIYEESGENSAARDMLIEALALEPDNPRALTALGHLREESGEREQAIANYSRSLVMNRNQPDVAQRLASLRSSGVSAPTTTPGGTRIVSNPSDPAAARVASLPPASSPPPPPPAASPTTSAGSGTGLNWKASQ